MHASRLAELGSWVALHASSLIQGPHDQPMLIATSYWVAARKRIQQWVTALRMFEKDFQNRQPGHQPWFALEIVIAEVLLSEMLTRIWSATVLIHDQTRGTDELFGLAHSVHLSHLEVRNRAQRIMLHGRAEDEDAFDRLNSLRRKLERWTDVFLAQLPNAPLAAQFGFDAKRVLDFAEENRESDPQATQTRQRILMASLQEDLERLPQLHTANPDLNRELAAGVLACFPADQFVPSQIPPAVRDLWIEKAHQETQMLVDHLAAFENQAEARHQPI